MLHVTADMFPTREEIRDVIASAAGAGESQSDMCLQFVVALLIGR